MEVLETVQMKTLIEGLSEGLLTQMSERGSNFSVGEAQLICVARALLKKSKILLVDEATSSVDPETDQLIQTVLREKFSDRTVLTIAHRLQTVLDSDRILVLGNGSILEFDTPEKLLAKDIEKDENAVFAKMFREALLHSNVSEEEEEGEN